MQRRQVLAWHLAVSLAVLSSLSHCLTVSPPDALLKLKILELQKFSKPAEVRDKRNSKDFDESQTDRKLSFLDLYGTKLTGPQADGEFDRSDKLLARKGKVKKIRKRARFPRRSYGGGGGGYEKQIKSSRPAESYEAPARQVSTHRPYVAPKSKSKPFTSFRSISPKTSKPSPTYSVTTPSYSAPEPPRESYSSPSPPPQTYTVRTPQSTYSKPSSTYFKPASTYSKPPSTTYSKPPSSTYSKPPSTYSKPPTAYPKPASTYSKPPSTYSKPPSTYSKPASTYSKPPSTYSKPPSTYSKPASTYSKPSSYSNPPSDSYSGGEYSYSYAVPETDTQAWEERTGYSTTGSYSVLLPDGRTMTVSYSVPDSETGFVAEVSYQGEPHYQQDYKPQPQYNHKREAKQTSNRNKNNFPNFRTKARKTYENELEKELQLPRQDFSNSKKTGKPADKGKEEKEIKYPHFESFQYSGARNDGVRPDRLDAVALFGEFPQLNPRQVKTEPRQSLRFTSPERPSRPSYLYPVKIVQENYQTNFHSRAIREDRNKEQASTSYLNTNVQPFVDIQPKHSPAVREDKYG